MSLASSAFSDPTRRAGPRWMLLGSLALNLFFIGVAIAMAIRAPAPTPRHWDPNVFVRVDLLAATLPSADAAILHKLINADHDQIAGAQADYQTARNEIRATLREDPFKVDDMRAAMTKTRLARQRFDIILQNVFANAAAQMSPAGRRALADWHLKRKHGDDQK